MNKDRWSKIELLVEQTLELPPDEQGAFVRKICGIDDELRKEITSLLQYKEQAFSFIQSFSENINRSSLAEIYEGTAGENQRINTIIGHYRITDVLGKGGMGVVYKARDTKLDRTVALKFLSLLLARSEKNKQRFTREAKAAAALNHPNICMIHAVEEHSGQQFISMEHIDGLTLREKLISADLSTEAAIEIGIRIAGALAEAHEKGIIHRDIKPENIMVDSKGRIKVMDFGLAKLRAEAVVKKKQTIMGTVPYISPEQANGNRVDHRTDIWSMGVVLYEMLSGERPFKGSHDQTIIHSILNEDSKPLHRTDADIPEELNTIVLKCLEKDPDERYQNAGELIHDLQRLRTNPSGIKVKRTNGIVKNITQLTSRPALASLATGIFVLILVGYWLFPSFNSPGPPSDNKIAVLPLESISKDSSDIQFTGGVHEELINRLAGIGDLTVIARSSVLIYPPEDRNLQRIGKELGVSSLMEGTVRRSGDQLRVSIQLIDADNLGTIWSGSYEEHADNVFEIQSRIAREVAGELQATLSPVEQQRLEDRPTDNPIAYQFYIRARQYLSQSRNKSGITFMAEKLLKRAIDEDPQFAHAWAMLVVAYSDSYWMRKKTPEQLEKMEQAMERAQRLDPSLPETQLAVAVYRYWSDTDNHQILSHFEAVLEQFPNQPLLYQYTALIHQRLGNWRLSIQHLENAIQLDPFNTDNYTQLFYTYWLIRNFEKAEATIDRLNELVPDETISLFLKTWIGLSKDGTLENHEIWWDHLRFNRNDPFIVEPYQWGLYNTLKRNWSEALRGYMNIEQEMAENSQYQYTTRRYLIAVTLEAQGKQTRALSHYEQVRNHLENLRDEYPDEPRYRTALGKVYARLGEFEKAIREGEKATELTPVTQNAVLGSFFEIELAEIYAWSGQEELAIDKLEYAFSIPSWAHKKRIRLDPRWDPLRDHPRFQELIAGEDEPYLEDL